MGLFEDLYQVLSPYANAIKNRYTKDEVDDAIDDVRAELTQNINSIIPELEASNFYRDFKINMLIEILKTAAFADDTLPAELMYELEASEGSVLYSLPAFTEFTGDSNERINTGITPLSTMSDFTIAFSVTINNAPYNSYIFQCMEVTDPYYGIKVQRRVDGSNELVVGAQKQTFADNSFKCVIKHKGGTSAFNAAIGVNGSKSAFSFTESEKNLSNTLFIGGNEFKGIIQDFKWYTSVWPDALIDAYVKG